MTADRILGIETAVMRRPAVVRRGTDVMSSVVR